VQVGEQAVFDARKGDLAAQPDGTPPAT